MQVMEGGTRKAKVRQGVILDMISHPAESGARGGAALLGNKESLAGTRLGTSARVTSIPPPARRGYHLRRRDGFSLDDPEGARGGIGLFIACFRPHHVLAQIVP